MKYVLLTMISENSFWHLIDLWQSVVVELLLLLQGIIMYGILQLFVFHLIILLTLGRENFSTETIFQTDIFIVLVNSLCC